MFADRSFEHINDYAPTDTKWSLIKLHGSVNWASEVLNSIPGEESTNINEFVRDLSGPLELAKGIVVVPGNRGLNGFERNRRFRENKYLYPRLALPAEGPKSPLCPPEYIDKAREFLVKCENFLFIGFSGLDKNVLDLFLDVGKVQQIKVVCENQNSARTTFQRLRKGNDRLLPSSYGSEDACLYEAGFRSFVGSQTFQDFLTGNE